MAIDINNGLPLQKHFIAVHASSQASSESLQRTKVLIDTFTPYLIGEKAQFLRKNGTSLKNPEIQRYLVTVNCLRALPFAKTVIENHKIEYIHYILQKSLHYEVLFPYAIPSLYF